MEKWKLGVLRAGMRIAQQLTWKGKKAVGRQNLKMGQQIGDGRLGQRKVGRKNLEERIFGMAFELVEDQLSGDWNVDEKFEKFWKAQDKTGFGKI